MRFTRNKMSAEESSSLVRTKTTELVATTQGYARCLMITVTRLPQIYVLYVSLRRELSYCCCKVSLTFPTN